MKITYISASVIPSTKANSVNVMKMCNGLAETGNKITLVGTEGKHQVDDNFSYYKVKESFQLKLGRNNKFSSIHRLIKGLKYSREADIIYTRWIVAAMILILFTNKKIVYEHHAPFKKRLYKFFESRIIKSEKVIRHIFITNSLKNYFLKKHSYIKGKDIKVLPDGADPMIINEHDSKEFDCIYIGSFQKGKGVETVIEVANSLPSISFAIVGGEKKEVEEMKSLATNNNIKWFGYLPHNETYNILNLAKIALLPNQPEVLVGNNQDIGKWTSPMKLFEYMANKKAIIASDLDVLKEILVNEENSLLVSYSEIPEWQAAIERLLSNDELLEGISRNAYNDLNKNYTWKSRAKKAIEGLK